MPRSRPQAIRRAANRECLCSSGLPGTFADIESPEATTEQERRKRQFAMRRIAAGAAMQGTTGAVEEDGRRVRGKKGTPQGGVPACARPSDAHAAPRPMIRRWRLAVSRPYRGLRINRMKSRPFLSGFVPLWLREWQHAQLSLKLRGHYNYYAEFGATTRLYPRSGTRFSEYG